jgi:hypothetical protein
MTCAEFVERVTAYLDLALDAGAHREFLDHLGGCEGCCGYLAQVRQTIDLLSALRDT